MILERQKISVKIERGGFFEKKGGEKSADNKLQRVYRELLGMLKGLQICFFLYNRGCCEGRTDS